MGADLNKATSEFSFAPDKNNSTKLYQKICYFYQEQNVINRFFFYDNNSNRNVYFPIIFEISVQTEIILSQNNL